ncbi:hypothetical protein [Dongia sp.]|uniref:hypothetical protein n=1 Tax=Dongia sp. TaxID=1977262 RepID=UPI0035B0BEB2
MTRPSLAVIILVGILAGPALAQEDPFLPSEFGAEQGMSPIDFDAARMSYFNQADTNGDLYLSHDEIDHAGSQGNSTLFEGSDLDGDGKISIDEFIESGNDLFARLDANGDGVLSAGEM